MRRRLPRILLLVALVAITPVLAGCESFDPDRLDPFGWNAKKKLPGKRELLFPNGVPGVTQGIPPEYQAGYKPPGSDDLSLTGEGQPAAGTPAAQTAKSAPVKPVRQIEAHQAQEGQAEAPRGQAQTQAEGERDRIEAGRHPGAMAFDAAAERG